MNAYKRIFTIVVDSLGVGTMEDSAQYGDVGVDTLGHISEQMSSFPSPICKNWDLPTCPP